jgi:hypothetical protein
VHAHAGLADRGLRKAKVMTMGRSIRWCPVPTLPDRADCYPPWPSNFGSACFSFRKKIYPNYFRYARPYYRIFVTIA